MAQLKRRPLDYSTQEIETSDFDFSSSHATSQPCSYSSPQDGSASLMQNIASSNSNDVLIDQKPVLPPKPFHGPPIYREPPNPPTHDEVTHHHPDICINSSSSRPLDTVPYSHNSYTSERLVHPGSRTHAWVQEHKTSGKLVGEKWSSLQRKLRSFLSQSSSSKELTEFERRSTIEDRSEKESLQKSTHFSASGFNMTPPSAAEQNSAAISASSFGENSVALSLPQPAIHSHRMPYQIERHPFAASNTSENEHGDSIDPDQLRDTCNKFFAREQRISWTNYLSSQNCYSNNIKSSYDYDKLVPKEIIGRPSQEKKHVLPSDPETQYGGLVSHPHVNRTHDSAPKQSDVSSTVVEGSFYAKRVQNINENGIPNSSNETEVPNKKSEALPSDTLPSCSLDCADGTEVYKSSSESGRGTMHSSMHGSKSVISPQSSGVSAVSNLDTSIDSDHSANGAIWNQHAHDYKDKRYPDDFQGNQVGHIYETPSTSINCRQLNGNEEEHAASSDSLSDSPPPPTSLIPSAPASAENSPKLSSEAKYKLSLSASALNSCTSSNDHFQKVCEIAAKHPGKKSSVRRTTSSNQIACRHRNGKSAQFSKSTASVGHRLGVSHGNYSSRKYSSSPPSRHHSRIQLAYPCFLDNGDTELTSTTTGLDMESLLDEEDYYSSDLSAAASAMEPNEVSTIKKQLDGLETMYSEILRVLGVKNSCKATPFASSVSNPLDTSCHSHRKMNGSLSSLTGHSSVSRGNHSFADKRGISEKRRTREYRTSSASKRLQRLESHVVTLARSVAHLSSEMRTQHVLVQELENMKQDVTWVQERLRLMQLAQGCHPNSGGSKNLPLPMLRDWDEFHKEVIELLNPCRAKKLTKFFGDEPPLIRQFLKRLGYEKYASNFENEKIGIKELPYLTEERLQKMGIPMGPRIRILQEAISCYPQNQYKVYIV